MDDTTARHTDVPPVGTGGEDGTLSLARSVQGRYDRLSPLKGGGMVTGMERLQGMAGAGASLSMEIIGRWSTRDVPAVHGQLPFRSGIRRAAIPGGDAPGVQAADRAQSLSLLQASSVVVGNGSVSGRPAMDRRAATAARLQPRLSGSVGQALAGSPGATAMNERLSPSAMPHTAGGPPLSVQRSAATERPSAIGRRIATGQPAMTGQSAMTDQPAITDQPGAGTGLLPVSARMDEASHSSLQRAVAPMTAEAGEPAAEQVSTARAPGAVQPLPGSQDSSTGPALSPVARPAGARREVQLVRLSDTVLRKNGNRETEQAGTFGEPSRLPRGSTATADAAPSGKSPGIGSTESRAGSGHDTSLPLSRAQEASIAPVSAPQDPVPFASSSAPEPAASTGETTASFSARSFAKGQPYLLRRLPSVDSIGSAETGSGQGIGSTTPGRHAEMRAAPVALQRKTAGAATSSLSHRAMVSPLSLQRDAVSAAPAEAEHPVVTGSPVHTVAPSSRDGAGSPVAGVLPLSARWERLNRTAGGGELAGNGSGAAALAAAPRTPAMLPLAKGAMPGAVSRQVSDFSPAGTRAGSSAYLQRTAEQEVTSAPQPAAAPGAPIPATTSSAIPAPAAVLPLPGGALEEPDLERLADRVYAIIEQRLIIEKERRGL